MITPKLRVFVAAALVGAPAPCVYAQSLAARVRSAPAGRVQFEFPERAGACGDGESFVSTGDNSFYGNFSIANGVSSRPCTPGPVRVVLDRADGALTGIETNVGPLHPAEGATDLGMIAPREAADYLMSIAGSTEGRASRDAIFPATLAEGVDVSAALLALVRNQDRPLETRRSALSALARGDNPSRDVADALVRIARDDNENQSLRQHAFSVLARLPHGAGIPMLEQLANDRTMSWDTEQSLRALAQSGDPRAREFLRKQVQRTDLSDATIAIAIRGLGSTYATGQDIDLLRGMFPKLTGDHSRTAVLEAIARRGTASDAQWLLSVARDPNQPIETRRRALDMASRGGMSNAQMLALYDGVSDPALKESLIRLYGQNGDRAAVDKLISIARTDSNYTLRRRAISSLSRTEDPRARQALQEITTGTITQ